MSENQESYSVIIEIFRKGQYRIFSYRLENEHFEAIKYSTITKLPETVAKRSLLPDEYENFKKYISDFPIEKLEEEYSNRNVKGEHHLTYQITIGNKHKDVYVYHQEQTDLKNLFNMLAKLAPPNEALYYYTD